MARFNPLRRDLAATLHGLQSELNRLFDEYVSPARFTSGATTGPPVDVDVESTGWLPAVDVYESPEEIVLLADLPGVDPATIDLSVTGNVLSLRGEKRPEEVPGSRAATRERQFGPFHRQVGLTSDVNFDAVQAEARNGVLKVRLPKIEAAKPRTIPVQPR